MSNEENSYRLAPRYDWAADTLELGTIIKNPNAPHLPLDTRSPINFEKIYNGAPQEKYELELERSVGGAIGIFTQFLQLIFGIGADIAIAGSKTKVRKYSFDRLTTKYFIPSSTYVQGSLRRPAVAEAFRPGYLSHSKLYMITGIMYVEGARMMTEDQKSFGILGSVGVDGTLAAGVPASAGVEAEREWEVKNNVSFNGTAKRIFAYQLYQIRQRKGRDPTQKEYVEGALLGGVNGCDDWRDKFEVVLYEVDESE